MYLRRTICQIFHNLNFYDGLLQSLGLLRTNDPNGYRACKLEILDSLDVNTIYIMRRVNTPSVAPSRVLPKDKADDEGQDLKMAEAEIESLKVLADVEEEFEKAADQLATRLMPITTSAQRLQFYARFKQAREGPCNTPKPGIFNFQAKQKWDAWKSLANMTPAQAMRSYIRAIDELDQNWRSCAAGSSENKYRPLGSSFGLTVSTLRAAHNGDDDVDEDRKTIVDWVKECNVTRALDALDESNVVQDLNILDDEGMGLLHWASDRGAAELVVALVRHGADVNLRDRDGQTALHYASSCGHSEVLRELLRLRADRTKTDNDGQTAEDVSSDDCIASLFHREGPEKNE